MFILRKVKSRKHSFKESKVIKLSRYLVNILNQEAIQMSNSYSTLKDLSAQIPAQLWGVKQEINALEKKLSALERNPNQLAEYWFYRTYRVKLTSKVPS